MAFTVDDLARVEAALASGTLRVRMGDRDVQYQTTRELMALRDLITRDLQASGVLTRPARYSFAGHARG